MKKKFKLQDLDCANCAAKMEEAIKKIPGVNDASVSFMMQKMTVETADDAAFDDIMPVSYTHLDVYKRQNKNSAQLFFTVHPHISMGRFHTRIKICPRKYARQAPFHEQKSAAKQRKASKMRFCEWRV